MSPRIPPVVVTAACGLLMWLAARATPSLAGDLPARHVVAALLAGLGIGVSLAGVASFRRARTTTNPLRPDAASSLVTSGIYSRTRNPMYVGFALVLLAWGAWLAHPVTLLALPAFVAWMNRYQIGPEERAMEALFGAEFQRYRATVRRWL